MRLSRRNAIRSIAALPIAVSSNALGNAATCSDLAEASDGIDLAGLPTRKEIWNWLLWLSSIGPKHTGNDAHKKFIDFLENQMVGIPHIKLSRDTYSFTRWEAVSWSLRAREPGNDWDIVPVSSYYPYSGETTDEGVTGQLVYVGSNPPRDITRSRSLEIPGLENVGDLTGKIVLLDAPVHGMRYADTYDPWGTYCEDFKLRDVSTDSIWQARSYPGLETFKKAGAKGVILSWSDFSDENIAGHYLPQQSPLQRIPCLWTSKNNGRKLRQVADRGGDATLVLQANVTPKAQSDTVIATLPGTSDETIVVVTHTDGPNVVQENGGLALVALAQYLGSLPKGTLRRTYVFVFVTGHMSAEVPGSRGFIKSHPDILDRTVAALAIEHLGTREWRDDDNGEFKPTGEYEVSTVIIKEKNLAHLVLDTVQGSIDDRLAVLNPVHGRSSGEGGAFLAIGIPTISFIPTPTYLLKASESSCIEKLDSRLFHAQVMNLAKILRRLDTLSVAELAV